MLANDELAARVTAIAACARDLGIALGSDAAPVLPIIARALTGACDAIAWPETLAPWEDEDDDELWTLDGELHPADPSERRPGDTTGRRRAKRKTHRSARKQSRRRLAGSRSRATRHARPRRLGPGDAPAAPASASS